MLATNYTVNNDARANLEMASTDKPVVPNLMEQTERVACEIGKLEENLAGLLRFVAATVPTGPKADAYPGGPITDRLAWCFRTVSHCSDMLNDIRDFVR